MTFFKNLKAGNISGAYIFHGEEEFIKDSALASLVASLDDATRELNMQVLQTFDPDEIIAACETLPFFAERRLVVCKDLPGPKASKNAKDTEEDSKSSSKDDAGKKIAAYIPNLPSTTLLLFFVRGKANGTTALVKAIKASGNLVDFDPCKPDEAEKWVLQRAKKLNVTITPAAAHHLVNLAGTDLSLLSSEFSKAAAYAGFGNEVTKEHISACVIRNLEVQVFDMIEYFQHGKAQDGLRSYKRMLADGESAFGMAALLESNFKRMLAARELMDKGVNKANAVQRMGGSPYSARKAYETAVSYSRSDIIQNIRRFANVGYLQVSGQQSAESALEEALIACMPKRRIG